MQTQTNTTGVDFVLANLQATLQSTGNYSGNSAPAIPDIIALDPQNALQQTGRVPGGAAYQKGSNAAYIPPNALGTVVANTNAGQVLLAGWETRPSKLTCTKNGAFVVQTNGTTPVVVPLTNTATNTNGQVGDTVFASWNQIVFYNLTGLGIDNTNAAGMTVASSNTNGANIGLTPVNAVGGYTLAGGGGAAVQQNWNGVTIAANAANITITPTAGGIFAGVISGS
jgi:hypothetical protein